jgi:hypothetical protein
MPQPDLPARLRDNFSLAPYLRDRFYIPGEDAGTEVGYTDYPFATRNCCL